MDAIEAQELTRKTAEEARARTAAMAEADLVALQEYIDATVYTQVQGIHRAIGHAATELRSAAHFTYSERIARGRNTPDTVDFILIVAGIITDKTTEQLEEAGFEVSRQNHEVVDYRDHATAPPEYLDTNFTVSWTPA